MSLDEFDGWSVVLRRLAELKSLDKQFQVFGASHHRYAFASVVSPKALDKFERFLRCRLPGDLRYVYLHIGDGGAGPYYGIVPLACLTNYRADENYPGISALRVLAPRWSIHGQRLILGGEFLVDHDEIRGLIAIIDEGCGHEVCLVMNGEMTGRLVFVSSDGRVAESDYTLRKLYMRWLDREIEVFRYVEKSIDAGCSLDDISSALKSTYGRGDAGDIACSILDVLKPINLPAYSYRGGTQLPWYREQVANYQRLLKS